MAKSKQQEALQLLDDLDSFTPISGGESAAPSTQPTAEGEAEVLAFLDEITQKSSEATRPAAVNIERPISRSGTPVGSIRKSTERVRLGGGPASSTSSPAKASGPSKPSDATQKDLPSSSSGGWGWGSVWNTASAALQQAKTVVDEQVKQLPAQLPTNEQAQKWREGVMEYAKSAQIDKLGQDFKRVGLSTLTDILNVVAPPIAEHEMIQVWLSHDMKGYDGIESLTYRSFARIMEQVEGGDLVVNRGEESRPKEGTSEGRDLSTVDGLDAAIKLAVVNIEELIKAKNAKPAKPSIASAATYYSYVYLRIQPFLVSHTVSAPSSSDGSPSDQLEHQNLQFLLYLADPVHKITHTTITQAVPGKWLPLWDQYDWVEDLVAEALRVGVEVIGQEYIVSRMGWGGGTGTGFGKATPAAETTEEKAAAKEED